MACTLIMYGVSVMRLSHYGLLTLLLILTSPFSFSEDSDQKSIKTNRYSYTTTQPSDSQKNLLSVVVTIRFPVSIKTIGGALESILSQSGYRLDESGSVDDEQYYLYMLMLPETQRVFNTVTLKSVLDVLGNESYQLKINPVKRTIRYQLKESYNNYISQDEIALAKSQWQSRKSSIQNKKQLSENDVKKPLSSPAYYGPVIRGESLSSIAYSLSHYGASAEKIMAAIYLKNSGSFLNKNINLLIEGTKLILPRKEFVQSISAIQAKQLVELHYQRWRGNNKGGVTF